MNHLLQADPPVDAGNQTPNWFLIAICVLLLLAGLLFLYWHFTQKKGNSKQAEATTQTLAEAKKQAPPSSKSSGEARAPKPKPGLTLDSLNTSASTTQAPSPTMHDTPPPPPGATPIPAAPIASVGPGDFEKALAQAGQRMDALLAQTTELTRQLKLSEKAKNDTALELSKAAGELTKQLEHKDSELAKLSALLEQKSSYPSLRALIEVKKLCQDMRGTLKPLSHDDLIKFIADDIDNKLSGLDVQMLEYAPGTPLEKIPGEQVENSARFELTQDPTQVNHIARLLRPCYYIERDSKRIIVAKASVVLYRLAPVTPTPTPYTPPSA